MLSKLDKKQIIVESNKIKQDLKYLKVQEAQKNFIRKFIKDNKKAIIFYSILIAIETLITLSLPIINRVYLKYNFDVLDYRAFYITVAVLVVLTILFVVNSYYSLLTGMKLTMKLINEVREAWFIRYFKIPSALKTTIDRKKLLTKFLYHSQLFKIGVTSSINEGAHAILLYTGILIYSYAFNAKLFLILLLSAPLLIVVYLVSYLIGKFYIAREQTFNTKIVGLLTDSVFSYDLFKTQGRELEKIKEMENLIELDTHFRIRRQLWIKFSHRLLYGIILLFGIGLYVIQTFWPFFELDSVFTIASDGIILGFFTHLIFLISRTGMFMPAFKLGLLLAAPHFTYEKSDFKSKSKKWKTLKIKSKKTKLSYYGNYIKDLSISLKKGDKVLFFSPKPYGKTSFAKILAGQKSSDSIFFHVDKARTPSLQWCENSKENYFISPNITYNTTVGEVVFGKNNLFVSSKEIKNSYSILKKHSIFSFIFDSNKTLGKNACTKSLSGTQQVLIQIAHCLVSDKQLIAVDHACVDSTNDQVIEGFKILISQKPDTTIAFFDSQKNNLFEYAKTYEISKNSIQEI